MKRVNKLKLFREVPLPSWHRRGGYAINKNCEATLAAQTGWSGLPKSLGLVPFLTTPSAPSKDATRHLLDVASTPPMSGGE